MDVIFDFSRVILFPKDENYEGGLNGLNKERKVRGEPFFNHFRFNLELLEYLSSNPSDYYIFTSDSIQEEPECREKLKEIFKKVFTARDLDYRKTDPEVYTYLCEEIDSSPKETLFVDDTLKNIEAARASGLQTHHYQGNDALISILRRL